MLVEERDELRAERLDLGIERELHAIQHIKYLTFDARCAMTNGMLDAEKILITGATGKIAFPDRAGAGAAQRGVGRGPPAESGRPRQARGRGHHTLSRST